MLKSLAVSQLVYLLSPLRSNHHAIKEINDMFYHFLWNGKGDKIKRKVMINEPEYGGLKMIDLYLFIYLFITALFVIINTKRLPSGRN